MIHVLPPFVHAYDLPEREGVEFSSFPAGEPHIRLTDWNSLDIHYDHQFGDDLPRELLQLQLIGDAAKRHGVIINEIRIGYAPFGRQDRVAVPGEPLSVAVFANIINSLNAFSVFLEDPHSDVLPALLNNCQVIHQAELLKPAIQRIQAAWGGSFFLVAPDAGAAKKIHQLAAITSPMDVLICSKYRDPRTGTLSGFEVPPIPDRWVEGPAAPTAIIVDDICDGGRTFIEISELLCVNGHMGKIILVVSHGLFTKGIDALHNIDEVYVKQERMK
jgi:ribose-phosphate pyrophosphokinase